VRDAVAAYLALAEHMPGDDFNGRAFNFGTETPVSVLELVDVILRLMGRTDLAPVVLNQASHEIPRQFLDCTRARTLMDWRPGHSLEDGLNETIAWYEAWLERTAPAELPVGTE
jgi:CDP-glucose 4,6-dehydratase